MTNEAPTAVRAAIATWFQTLPPGAIETLRNDLKVVQHPLEKRTAAIEKGLQKIAANLRATDSLHEIEVEDTKDTFDAIRLRMDGIARNAEEGVGWAMRLDDRVERLESDTNGTDLDVDALSRKVQELTERLSYMDDLTRKVAVLTARLEALEGRK